MILTYTKMIDPKPLAAFFEYTIRPLIQDSCELLDRMEKCGIEPKLILKSSIKIMIWQIVVQTLTTIFVTGAICLTIIRLVA